MTWSDNPGVLARLHGLLESGASFTVAAEALGVTRSAVACVVKKNRDDGVPGWEAAALDANRSRHQRAHSVAHLGQPRPEKKTRKPRMKLVSSR